MLFPEVEEDAISDEQDHDVLEDGEEGSAPDPGVARAASRQPSTCGITFGVDIAIATTVRLSRVGGSLCARRRRGRPLEDFDPKDYGLLAGRWRRVPVPSVDFEIDLQHTAGPHVPGP